MKKIYLLLAPALFLACTTQQSQNKALPFDTNTDLAIEAKDSTGKPLPDVNENVYSIVKLVLDTTKEYAEASRVIDSATNHKKGVAFWVEQNEKKTDSIYTVNVGHNREDRFERFFSWTVDVKNRKVVECLDAVSGQSLPLAEYRKRNKENGFSW